jgi:CheY-like chemotaxis protein
VTFNIPQSWSVLVLDDSEDRISWFRQRLRNVKFAKTSAAAINLFSQHRFKVAFLDHDLHWMDAGFPHRQHGNGKEVARYLASHGFDGIVVIHSRSEQADVMAKILPQAKVCPFGDFDITECSEVAASHTRMPI